MDINIVLKKRHFYTLLLIVALALGAVMVNAFGSGGPPATFGHSVDELDTPTCGGSQALTDTGSGMVCTSVATSDTRCDTTTCGTIDLSSNSDVDLSGSGARFFIEQNDQDITIQNGEIEIGSGNNNGELRFDAGDTRTSRVEFQHTGQTGFISFTDSAGSPGTSTMEFNNPGGDIRVVTPSSGDLVITTGGIEVGSSNPIRINQPTSNRIQFIANTGAGNEEVGIGTNPTVNLDVAQTGADTTLFRLTDSDGACGHNPESGGEVISCSSDARLKDNIRDAASVMDKLMKFRLRDFTVKASGEERVGVVAQELQDVFPDMVSENDDGYLMVEQPNSWELVKAVQELKQENDLLKSELCAKDSSYSFCA